MLLDAFEFLWIIVKNTHVWLLLSACIVAVGVKDGFAGVAVTFGGLFLFLLCFDIFEMETLARIFLAIAVGLGITFFVWIARD
jgi:hypothetical protein